MGAGQIIARKTPNVITTTSSLAELVAIDRALRWARLYALSHGKPVCVRYTSEYAARIASGAWKAKKHKAMAEAARHSWTALKKANGERVWTRHVPASATEATVAQQLAQRGKHGESIYMAAVT